MRKLSVGQYFYRSEDKNRSTLYLKLESYLYKGGGLGDDLLYFERNAVIIKSASDLPVGTTELVAGYEEVVPATELTLFA